MPEPQEAVHWERAGPTWWTSPVGYVQEEEGVWAGYAYHNQRAGVAWTQRKGGFGTALAAMRWVERAAEP